MIDLDEIKRINEARERVMTGYEKWLVELYDTRYDSGRDVRTKQFDLAHMIWEDRYFECRDNPSHGLMKVFEMQRIAGKYMYDKKRAWDVGLNWSNLHNVFPNASPMTIFVNKLFPTLDGMDGNSKNTSHLIHSYKFDLDNFNGLCYHVNLMFDQVFIVRVKR